MKVSVIIPVYNGEKFITRAVNSALNQTYPDIQVIIVDDCSTDRTADVLMSEFSQMIGNKIIYHRNPVNMERSYSRNIGVEMSEGEFVFFLDYDDEWERDYIQSSVDYLRDYDIVYSFPRTFIDEEGNTIRVSKKAIADDVGKIIFSGQIGYPSASGFRKSSFLGYREDIILREDWEIFIRSYLKGMRIKVVDNNKVRMREHRGRTSRNRKMMLSTLKVYQEYRDSIPENYRADFLFHVADICMRFGDLKTGWKLLFESISIDRRILRDRRKLLSVAKRGFRIDRMLKV